MLAQGICLEAPPGVESEVPGVAEWGAISGKSGHSHPCGNPCRLHASDRW